MIHKTAGSVLLLLVATSASAIPRYSARYEQSCALCHHNPTGGGMRSAYATQYLVPAEMVLRPYAPEAMARIEPQISKSVTLGTDIRTMYHFSERNFEYPNFFEMQGSVELAFQADERFSAYLDQGMSRTNEVYAIGYLLPLTGYVKMGRFTPPFGWKLDDHTAFTRRFLGLIPPSHTDTGVEIGIAPGRLAAQVALMNGSPGSASDQDRRLSETATATWRARVGIVGIGIGGSYWHHQAPGLARSSAGPMGYLKLRSWIWQGECDWSRVEDAKGPDHTELVTSQELSLEAWRGIYLRATYDFHDPDIDEKRGSLTRTGVGVDALPAPFVGVKAMWNAFRTENRASGTGAFGPNYDQLEVQLHMYY